MRYGGEVDRRSLQRLRRELAGPRATRDTRCDGRGGAGDTAARLVLRVATQHEKIMRE